MNENIEKLMELISSAALCQELTSMSESIKTVTSDVEYMRLYSIRCTEVKDVLLKIFLTRYLGIELLICLPAKIKFGSNPFSLAKYVR